MINYMQFTDLGIPDEICKKHDLRIGETVGVNFERDLQGPYMEIGSLAQFEQSLPETQYHMPDEFFDFFMGDVHDDRNLKNLHIALTKPYEECLVKEIKDEKTEEEKMIIGLEKDLLEGIATDIQYLLNPSLTAVFTTAQYNNVNIVITHDKSTLEKSYMDKLDLHFHGRVIFTEVTKMPQGTYYVGSNYKALKHVKGYGYKYNLPNCLLYGLFVLDYKKMSDDKTPLYDLNVKKKNKIYRTMWGDCYPGIYYYDPTTVFGDKNYRRNAITIVSTRVRRSRSSSLMSTMYSQLGYGYPSEGTYEKRFSLSEYNEDESDQILTGRFISDGQHDKLVDIVSPPLAYEQRYFIVSTYGVVFDTIKEGYVKVTPRTSDTLLYMTDYDAACMLSGRRVTVKDHGSNTLNYTTGDIRFEYDQKGEMLLVPCTIGAYVTGESEKNNNARYVMIRADNLYFDHTGKNALAIKFTHLDGPLLTKSVRRFVWESRFKPGYSVVTTVATNETTYRRTDGKGLVLKLSVFRGGESVLKSLPDGMDTSIFTPYLRYETFDDL